MTADLGELERLCARLREDTSSPHHGGCANCDNVLKEDAADMLEDLSRRLRAAEGALEEIADLASLSVVGGDDFDKGARAARLEAADIARAALPIVGGSE